MYKHVNNVRATKQICNKQQMKIESKLERKKSAPPPLFPRFKIVAYRNVLKLGVRINGHITSSQL